MIWSEFAKKAEYAKNREYVKRESFPNLEFHTNHAPRENLNHFCSLPRKLPASLKACRNSGIPEFASFADGVNNYLSAIQAALTLEWSKGQLEGQVNRLKIFKRQVCGRANFDLLRIRVLSET